MFLRDIMDKTAVMKVKLENQPDDSIFWLEQSYEQRLEALESIRQDYISWKHNDQQRFQKVYRIIKQS